MKFCLTTILALIQVGLFYAVTGYLHFIGAMKKPEDQDTYLFMGTILAAPTVYFAAMWLLCFIGLTSLSWVLLFFSVPPTLLWMGSAWFIYDCHQNPDKTRCKLAGKK